MTSFLFYDIETSGLNPAFDQILTFAAIRTDSDLNEIERYSITIQMRPDIVPSPGAFITHRLMPEELEQGICEYQAACKIHNIINVAGTVSVGYNNLGFDDEFLRFTFYRNLLEPYSHQYANGCYRIDLLPITTIYRVFKPDIINWPTHCDGKPSLKLELLSSINNFRISGRSHDAMSDVEATVELAKRLIQEKKVWEYCIRFFDKNWDRTRIDKIFNKPSYDDYPVAFLVSHRLADSIYIAPVIGIGRSYHYRNQSLWIRLDRDSFPNSANFNPDELFVIRKKDGENNIILPPLSRFWDRLSDEQRLFAKEKLSSIYQDEKSLLLFKQIIEYHRQFKYELVPEADIDSLLYTTPFFTNAEKREMELFHSKIVVSEKLAIIEDMQIPRVKSMAIRIMFRNYFNRYEQKISIESQSREVLPERVADLILKEYAKYMERVKCNSSDPDFNIKKIIGFKRDERLIPSKAIEELKIMVTDTTLDDEQKKILERLELYIAKL